MLKNISSIEQFLKLPEGSLKAAIESEEEIEVGLPEGLITMTEEDKSIRETNLKREHEKAGAEIAIKEYRNKLGLQFEGKTMDNLLTAYEESIKSKQTEEPNKRIKSLESDLEQMRTNFQTKQQEVESLSGQISSIKNESVINNTIMQSLPEGAALSISKDDVFMLFKSKNNIGVEEGKVVLLDGDQIVKDPTSLEPISINDKMQEFIKPYVKAVEGGSGGGDEPGAGSTGDDFESFMEEMEGQNISANSERFNQEMNKRIAAGTLKM